MLARLVTAVLVLQFEAQAALAGQPLLIDVDTPTGSATYVLLENDIEVGDSNRFFRLVRRTPHVTGVMLSSMGGSADDGLAIAKYIFERKLDTMVTATCHSICAIMFLAGNRRFVTVDAAITVHSAYKQIGDWVAVDHRTNGTVAWFLGHMGYPLPLARLWVTTPTEGAAPITLEMSEKLGLGFTVID